jgi:Na+/glutamate symporter
MPRVSLPPEFAIAQLTAVAAVNAVLFALFPAKLVFPFAIASACLIVMQRTRLPRQAGAEPIGCLGALLGLIGGAAIGASCVRTAANAPEFSALPIALGSAGAVIGGVAGRFIRFAVYRKRQISNEPRRLRASDLDDIHRKKLRAELEIVTKLMSQAEHDGEAEVLANLAAYRARLEQDLASCPRQGRASNGSPCLPEESG